MDKNVFDIQESTIIDVISLKTGFILCFDNGFTMGILKNSYEQAFLLNNLGEMWQGETLKIVFLDGRVMFLVTRTGNMCFIKRNYDANLVTNEIRNEDYLETNYNLNVFVFNSLVRESLIEHEKVKRKK